MKFREFNQQEIDDCREIYFEQKGKDYKRIEQRMKAKGWIKFTRNLLSARRLSIGLVPGWPELYGWKKELDGKTIARPAARRYTFESWLAREFPKWIWSWPYQRYLYKRLHDVTTGKCKRLMIFLPPRHGKSELVTVRYTAWRLLEDAKLNIILGSYNQRLANRFSRKVMRVVDSATRGEKKEKIPQSRKDTKKKKEEGTTKQHEETRKKQISKKQISKKETPYREEPKKRSLTQSVDEWETAEGGGVRAIGVGGGITGFGADLIVIDDPIKSRAEAESEIYRDNVWNWFNDDLYTRLEPDAAIILIQTRWHEDDLAGRLLREMEDGGEKWEVVSLPALAEAGEVRNAEGGSRNEEETCNGGEYGLRKEDLTTEQHGKERKEIDTKNPHSAIPDQHLKNPPADAGGSDLDPLGRREGEALCPARFDKEALLRIKAKLGSYGFSALYQQEPIPAGGGAFRREWFRHIVDEAPKGLRWARGYDLAVSTKTSADYTASFRCAFDRGGNLYIADGFRKRIEYPEQRRFVIERMQAESDTRHGVESALHGQALVQDLRRERGVRCRPLKSVRVDGDKLTRALAWANLAEEGRVVLVRGPWIADFLDEVCRFTGRNDRHDDQVDAVSLAVRLLSEKDKRLYDL